MPQEARRKLHDAAGAVGSPQNLSRLVEATPARSDGLLAAFRDAGRMLRSGAGSGRDRKRRRYGATDGGALGGGGGSRPGRGRGVVVAQRTEGTMAGGKVQ